MESNWNLLHDEASGYNYYLNETTGESCWEEEWTGDAGGEYYEDESLVQEHDDDNPRYLTHHEAIYDYSDYSKQADGAEEKYHPQSLLIAEKWKDHSSLEVYDMAQDSAPVKVKQKDEDQDSCLSSCEPIVAESIAPEAVIPKSFENILLPPSSHPQLEQNQEIVASKGVSSIESSATLTKESRDESYPNVPTELKAAIAEDSPSEVAEIKTSAIAEIETSTIAEIEPSTIPETEPSTIAEIETPTIAGIEPSTISETEPSTIAEIETPTIAETEPFAVAEIEPSAVAKTEPCTITEIEPSTIPETEPSTIAEIETSTIAEIEPFAVAEIEPSTVAKTEPSAAAKTKTFTLPETKTSTTNTFAIAEEEQQVEAVIPSAEPTEDFSIQEGKKDKDDGISKEVTRKSKSKSRVMKSTESFEIQDKVDTLASEIVPSSTTAEPNLKKEVLLKDSVPAVNSVTINSPRNAAGNIPFPDTGETQQPTEAVDVEFEAPIVADRMHSDIPSKDMMTSASVALGSMMDTVSPKPVFQEQLPQPMDNQSSSMAPFAKVNVPASSETQNRRYSPISSANISSAALEENEFQSYAERENLAPQIKEDFIQEEQQENVLNQENTSSVNDSVDTSDVADTVVALSTEDERQETLVFEVVKSPLVNDDDLLTTVEVQEESTLLSTTSVIEEDEQGEHLTKVDAFNLSPMLQNVTHNEDKSGSTTPIEERDIDEREESKKVKPTGHIAQAVRRMSFKKNKSDSQAEIKSLKSKGKLSRTVKRMSKISTLLSWSSKKSKVISNEDPAIAETKVKTNEDAETAETTPEENDMAGGPSEAKTGVVHSNDDEYDNDKEQSSVRLDDDILSSNLIPAEAPAELTTTIDVDYTYEAIATAIADQDETAFLVGEGEDPDEEQDGEEPSASDVLGGYFDYFYSADEGKTLDATQPLNIDDGQKHEMMNDYLSYVQTEKDALSVKKHELPTLSISKVIPGTLQLRTDTEREVTTLLGIMAISRLKPLQLSMNKPLPKHTLMNRQPVVQKETHDRQTNKQRPGRRKRRTHQAPVIDWKAWKDENDRQYEQWKARQHAAEKLDKKRQQELKRASARAREKSRQERHLRKCEEMDTIRRTNDGLLRAQRHRHECLERATRRRAREDIDKRRVAQSKLVLASIASQDQFIQRMQSRRQTLCHSNEIQVKRWTQRKQKLHRAQQKAERKQLRELLSKISREV